MAPPPPSPADPAMCAEFEKLLLEVRSAYATGGPETETLAATLERKLRAWFERPAVADLEFVLQKKFTPERARALLFFPTVTEFGAYALLLREPPDGAPAEHPQVKLQILFLSMMPVWFQTKDAPPCCEVY